MAGRIIGLISCNYNDDSFGQLTAARSVASLPFGGRYRLLDFALSNMVNAGIRTIGLVTPYFYRSIMDHVGAGKEWSLDRKHGGLFLLPGSIFGPKAEQSNFVLRDITKNRSYLERTQAETVLICGSSKIFNMDFRPMFAAHEAAGGGITMLYKTVSDAQGQSGTYLEVSGEMVQSVTREAAGQANCFMDCFLIDRKLLLNFCEWYRNFSHIDLTDIIIDNLDTLQVQAFPFEGYLGQVRNISDYMRCSQDLLKLEAISDETKLLVRHRIDTDEQLFSYQDGLNGKIESLTAERKALYKQQRTVAVKSDTIMLEKVKSDISAISKELAVLRREVRLCDDIAMRSKVMREKIKAVREDEQSQRKEQKRDEQFRRRSGTGRQA